MSKQCSKYDLFQKVEKTKKYFWASEKRWLIWLTILVVDCDKLKKKMKHGMHNVKRNVGKYTGQYMKGIWK